MKWFGKLNNSLKNAHSALSDNIKRLIEGKKLTDQVIEGLEEILIASDLGVEVTKRITKALRKEKFGANVDNQELLLFLKKEIIAVMTSSSGDFMQNFIEGDKKRPYVILLCGVNGSGKTTTIGKLAFKFQQLGYSVMIAGCDTFRVAASDQLLIWSKRAGSCPIMIAEEGADPASVVYKSIEKAKKEEIDVLLIDTAGRLHNNKNLMDELKKCINVIQKIDSTAPHDTILVIDGTTGQNTHSQIDLFSNVINITGLIITKLDGSSKGGSIVNMSQKYQIPIYAIGVGEEINDIKKFDYEDFVAALLNIE